MKKSRNSRSGCEDREQWILGKQMASAVMNLNAPFCGGGPAEGPNMEWLEPIAKEIAENTSVVALEDVIPVLERALALAIEIEEDDGLGPDAMDEIRRIMEKDD